MERADDTWMADDLAADDEEGRRHIEAVQRLRDARRPAWVWTVVEAERDPAARMQPARDEAVAVPGQDRACCGQRPRRAAGRRRATAGRPGRKPLGAEQDDESGEQEREQTPPGRRPSDPAYGSPRRRHPASPSVREASAARAVPARSSWSARSSPSGRCDAVTARGVPAAPAAP